MNKIISKLQNNIEYIYKKNENTPRMAISFNISLNEPEEKIGIFALIARLLTQGTTNYNAEELANEFENYAIDFSSEIFPNYLKFRLICLNEDFNRAITLMDDVLNNSTFNEFEKERTKLKSEILAELDSPKTIAMDNYIKTIFKDHLYGSINSLTLLQQNLDKITIEEVINTYHKILNNSKKSLAIVGTLDKEEVLPLIENTFGQLPESINDGFNIPKPQPIEGKQEVIEIKNDINQAHIVKGWQVSTFENPKDYASLILLNIILGACGLSSRLFLELRDKKGLAYVVRSAYETFRLAGSFMIYIATEPKNIETSLKGFGEEIQKIKTILVSEEELNNAKNNFIGKCAFLNETNNQQASVYAKNNIIGLGFEYSEELKELVKQVTAQDILNCAQKYFNDNYVISIIKP